MIYFLGLLFFNPTSPTEAMSRWFQHKILEADLGLLQCFCTQLWNQQFLLSIYVVVQFYFPCCWNKDHLLQNWVPLRFPVSDICHCLFKLSYNDMKIATSSGCRIWIVHMWKIFAFFGRKSRMMQLIVSIIKHENWPLYDNMTILN